MVKFKLYRRLKQTPNLVVPAVILISAFLIYLPILSNQNLLLQRKNDLEIFFWPLVLFVKKQIVENHTFPLWYNTILSGTPLLPDPQAPLFYLPNIIFLILPISIGFITLFFLHTFFAGVGAYLAARLGFRFSKIASLFVAEAYILSPQLAGFLEAGHTGLVESLTWLPFTLLAVIKLAQKPKVSWSVLLAVSLAGLFYTHVVTFLLAAFSSVVLLGITLLKYRGNWLKSGKLFTFSGVLTFGLTAISLLPQLEWQKYTSRVWLAEKHEIYPAWSSITEYLGSIFWPWNLAWRVDTESWLALGVFIILLALIGFWHTKRWTKLFLLATSIIILLSTLNNASPFYSFVLSQDAFSLMRVTTRIWFIPTLVVLFLAGLGLEQLIRNKKTYKLGIILAGLALTELLLLSWLRLNKPVSDTKEFVSSQVYEFLEEDKEQFRVFCLDRCIPQKEAAERSLELVEGYSTLAQTNYYQQMWQFTGEYWNYYTLSLPPIGTYKFTEIQPDAKSLGEYNVKYVISPHPITSPGFPLEKNLGKYRIYQNNFFKPRAYFLSQEREPSREAKILEYNPNHIKVDTSEKESLWLVLSEVYSPGWTAYLNDAQKVTVQETPNALRFVDIKQDTEFVDFRYEPDSYKIGRVITLATVLILLGWGFKSWKKYFN